MILPARDAQVDQWKTHSTTPKPIQWWPRLTTHTRVKWRSSNPLARLMHPRVLSRLLTTKKLHPMMQCVSNKPSRNLQSQLLSLLLLGISSFTLVESSDLKIAALMLIMPFSLLGMVQSTALLSISGWRTPGVPSGDLTVTWGLKPNMEKKVCVVSTRCQSSQSLTEPYSSYDLSIQIKHSLLM